LRGEGTTTTMSADLQGNLPALVDNCIGNQSQAKIQLTLTRGEAAYFIWRHAVLSEAKRSEIMRLGTVTSLLQLLDKGNKEGRYAATGCLQYLVMQEDFMQLVCGAATGAKNIANFARVLVESHDRPKVCAAACLYSIACKPEYVTKLVPVVPQLIAATMTAEPKWAGVEHARTYAAGCLSNLAWIDTLGESMSYRERDTTYFKRELIAHGAISAMVKLMHDGLPEAQAHAVRTLRSLLLLEEAVELVMQERGLVQELVRVLIEGTDEGRSNAAGCVMSLCTEEAHTRTFTEAGAIQPLVAMLAPKIAEPPAGKKPKKKKKAPAMPPALAEGIVRASGALWHLSFDDRNKTAIADMECIPVLVKLIEMKGKKWKINMDLYRHVSGLLYNLSLESSNKHTMRESKTPAYLSDPLHERWLTEPLRRPVTAPAVV